jgi:ubiquinone/menaquinone biosynthesis C-methylase UbiE
VAEAPLPVEAGYALWSSVYDAPGNPLIFLEEIALDGLCRGLRPRRVVDLATGTGRHAIRFAHTGAMVIAVDRSEEMLAVARAKVHDLRLPNIHFMQASIDQPLQLPPKSADLGVCGLALSHIAALRETIGHLCQIVRPGGHVLLTDLHPQAIAEGLRTSFWKAGQQHVIETVRHSTEDYLEALRAHGAEIVTTAELPLGRAFRDLPRGLPENVANGDWRNLNLCWVVLAKMK